MNRAVLIGLALGLFGLAYLSRQSTTYTTYLTDIGSTNTGGNSMDNSGGNDILTTETQAAQGAATWVSQNGVDLIANFEGFSAKPYPDAGGWSIGYGHYMGARPTMNTITQSDALALLAADAGKAAQTILDSVTVGLTQNQFDALTSFIYNVGSGAFTSSTLLKKLNAGDFLGAIAEFPKWNHSQGKVNSALTQRRAAEQQLFAS